MKRFNKTCFLAMLALLLPAKMFACPACYGNVDSPLTEGMNWGIFTLLGIVITVLASILVFFIHIIRKAEAMAAEAEKSPKTIEV